MSEPLSTIEVGATSSGLKPDVNESPLFSLTNIAKTYVEREGPVLSISKLEIPRGKVVAVVGESGSGKTTLLNLLSALETPDPAVNGTPGPSLLFAPDSGTAAEELFAISDKRRQEIRSGFGFVFQQGYLLENLSCGGNIRIPSLVKRLISDGSVIRTMMLQVGLKRPEEMYDRPPLDVSGGERQRISVLRALNHGPCVVFADEPTSNLDLENANVVLAGLRSWCERHQNRTVLLVTHNVHQAADYADLAIVMADKKVRETVPIRDPYGKQLIAAVDLSKTLAKYSVSRTASVSSLDIPPQKRSTHPVLDFLKFVVSFAVSDVLPPISGKARGLFQRAFGRRNAQFHCIVSMFLASVLAFFFASLSHELTIHLRATVDDARLARIEVLGRQDGDNLLTSQDLKELKLPGVSAVIGYRVREMTVGQNQTASFSPSSEVSVVSTSLDDPILRTIGLLEFQQTTTGGIRINTSEGSLSSLLSTSSPAAARMGIVLSRATLGKLGFEGMPPKTIDIYPDYSSGAPEPALLVAVVDWLPKSADALISEQLFNAHFLAGTGQNRLPRYDAAVLYLSDLLKDGPPMYDKVQHMGYSVSTSEVGNLQAVAGLVSAIQYFNVVAGAGVFLVVFVTLTVSYTEAIRRKKKDIAVLRAYGTHMGLLYAIFLTEVTLVWLVAVMFAAPSDWFVARTVRNLVAEGFHSHGTPGTVSGSLWNLWAIAAILATSLAIAMVAVIWAMRDIKSERVAQSLRTPD